MAAPLRVRGIDNTSRQRGGNTQRGAGAAETVTLDKWWHLTGQPTARLRYNAAGSEIRADVELAPAPVDLGWLPAAEKLQYRLIRRQPVAGASPITTPLVDYDWWLPTDQAVRRAPARQGAGENKPAATPLIGFDWWMPTGQAVRPVIPRQSAGEGRSVFVPLVAFDWHRLVESFPRRIRRAPPYPMAGESAPVFTPLLAFEWAVLSGDLVGQRGRLQLPAEARVDVVVIEVVETGWLRLTEQPLFVPARALPGGQSAPVLVPTVPFEWPPMQQNPTLPLRPRHWYPYTSRIDLDLAITFDMWWARPPDPVRRIRRAVVFDAIFRPTGLIISVIPPSTVVQICFVPWDFDAAYPAPSGFTAEPLILTPSGFVMSAAAVALPSGYIEALQALTPSGFVAVIVPVAASGYAAEEDAPDPSGFVGAGAAPPAASGFVADAAKGTPWDMGA